MVSLSQGSATATFRELPALLQGIASDAKELVCGVEVTSRQAEAILQGLDAELAMLADDYRVEPAI